MNNLEKRNEKYKEQYGYSKPVFRMNEDGSVSYEYTSTRIFHHVHGGKISYVEKDDVYERTEHYSGKIMQDGLNVKNKTTKEERLIRKGHYPRRQKK